MEKFQELREIAKKKVQLADHMLSVTYPLVKEPKLLVSIMENTFLAYINAMGSLLYYERLFTKIPKFEDTFNSKLEMFKDKCLEKHKIDKIYVNDMTELKTLLLEHKKSTAEFTRKDKFVICSDNFSCKTISAIEMQRYINRAKLFIQYITAITSKNEGLFR